MSVGIFTGLLQYCPKNRATYFSPKKGREEKRYQNPLSRKFFFLETVSTIQLSFYIELFCENCTKINTPNNSTTFYHISSIGSSRPFFAKNETKIFAKKIICIKNPRVIVRRRPFSEASKKLNFLGICPYQGGGRPSLDILRKNVNNAQHTLKNPFY